MQAFGIVEAGLAAGGVGTFLLVVSHALGKATLLPIKDPFLVESLPHTEKSGDFRHAVIETQTASSERP